MWAFLSSLVSPIVSLISEAIPDKDKQAEVHAQLVRLQAELAKSLLDYEQKLLDARAKTVLADATGHSWLQRNWRPLVMLVFTGLVVARWLGFTAPNLSEAEAVQLWEIIKIGLGGYVVGRSAEKIAHLLKERK